MGPEFGEAQAPEPRSTESPGMPRAGAGASKTGCKTESLGFFPTDRNFAPPPPSQSAFGLHGLNPVPKRPRPKSPDSRSGAKGVCDWLENVQGRVDHERER